MVRASVASERARRGHKRASALGERAVPKNYPSERLNIVTTPICYQIGWQLNFVQAT